MMNLGKLINEYLEICEYQNSLDYKTIKAYKLDLEQFERFAISYPIFYSKQFIVKYIFFLKEKEYKIKTIKRKIASIKAFFTYLTFEDIIETNPFSKIRLNIKEPLILPKTINLEDLNKIFQYAYDRKSNCKKNLYQYVESVRNIIILEFLLGTGIRISELCNLTNDNVNLKNGFIKIQGKGAKERILPFFDENTCSLSNIYKKLNHRYSNKYFFLNSIGKKLSTQSVRRILKNYSIEAGIEYHITPHMFRHTFATMLLENDVNIRYIQQLLGHSSITTTQIYTHITSTKKEEIIKTKSPRLKVEVNKG